MFSCRCYHNRDNSDDQTDYAHGYQDCDEDTDPFRTIMSYACTSAVTVPRINWFSNPDVYYMGRATGTATEDCARSITENMVRRVFEGPSRQLSVGALTSRMQAASEMRELCRG